jgi:hypothetical protein
MISDGEQRLQRTLDHVEIQQTLLIYFHAMDSGNVEACRNVFTEDVESIYAVPKPAGLEAHMESFRSMCGKLGVKAQRMTRRGANATTDLALKHTSHFVGNMRIRVEGNTARAETYVIAHLFYEEDSNDYVVIRGLRYIDKLIRTPAGWRVRHRVHELNWVREGNASYVLPATMMMPADF